MCRLGQEYLEGQDDYQVKYDGLAEDHSREGHK